MTGAVDLDSTLNVDGAGTFQTTLHVKGALTIDTSLVGTANIAINGNCTLDVGKFVSSQPGAGANTHYEIFNTNGVIGSITSLASTTSYNTTSDATLKDDLGPSQDHGSRIDALAVRKFRFKGEDEERVGLMAQEAFAVAPFAVTPGEGDRPWMMDHSKFVPDLLAEMQDVRKRLTQLEAK